MPPVFLVKFPNLPLLSPETAHWAILLPTVPYIAGQLPRWGVLYHARKRGFCFPLSPNTEYERIEQFDLSGPNINIWDYYELCTVDLTDAEINVACLYVSNPRPFNLVTRNCQDWVKEVLQCLVNGGRMHEQWLQVISGQGWVTLNENCVHCLGSSLCRCRKK